MYLRTVKASGGKGVQHEYVRLVESYRQGGKKIQRVVCNLGRKDLLAEHLDSLVRLLGGERAESGFVAEKVRAAGAFDFGPELVARHLWRELGLEEILDRLGGRGRGNGASFCERSFVLVANRLCAPSSEHGLARWLETDFVCDRDGRRWVPLWREDSERRRSRTPRVRVELRQLKQWYRTLDQLQARKERIERELYLRLRDLFSLKVDLVFYDLTSTYFEGHGPESLARHGHSRDGKPRNRQVLVGLVMVDGWPITHHVFQGNWRDSTTVAQVLGDIEKRFGLRRVVFVGDRGMVTAENIALLEKKGQGYVVGLNRRRRLDVYEYIERATGAWIDCPVGTTASEKSCPPKTQVQEVAPKEPGVRVFVVRSEERTSSSGAGEESGESVVTRGNFAIDSQMQLALNTSGTSFPGGATATAWNWDVPLGSVEGAAPDWTWKIPPGTSGAHSTGADVAGGEPGNSVVGQVGPAGTPRRAAMVGATS